jgi:protein-S-isoprenylcysteine O-methyltransferase Ste14
MPVALVAIRRLVIDPEERYLSRQFAQAYTDYQQRVRRWL